MKQFNSAVVKVKNSEGVFEPIPALRGDTPYDIAKRNGFPGTEQDWYNHSYGGGWFTEAWELQGQINEANKSISGLQTQIDSQANTFNTRVPLWSIEEPLMKLSENDTKCLAQEYAANLELNKVVDNTVTIRMINSGTIYLHFDSNVNWLSDNRWECVAYIEIRLNDEVINHVDYYPGDADATFDIPLEVKPGDMLTLYAYLYPATLHTGNSDNGEHLFGVGFKNVNLYANVNALHTYDTLPYEVKTVTTEDVLNTLLGEE